MGLYERLIKVVENKALLQVDIMRVTSLNSDQKPKIEFRTTFSYKVIDGVEWEFRMMNSQAYASIHGLTRVAEAMPHQLKRAREVCKEYLTDDSGAEQFRNASNLFDEYADKIITQIPPQVSMVHFHSHIRIGTVPFTCTTRDIRDVLKDLKMRFFAFHENLSAHKVELLHEEILNLIPTLEHLHRAGRVFEVICDTLNSLHRQTLSI